MDGIEMVQLLKDNKETQGIPVIFLTGVDSPKNVVDCFEIDAENFMCKPINPKVLAAQIQQVLTEHFSSN